MSNPESAKILVVDDEPELRELLAETLKAPGRRIESAASGEEAIEMARRDRPDLIVTDLCLGGCNGLEVIDRVRGQAGDVPAVVITGHADVGAMTRASQRRPVELMTKPLDLQHLRHTVQQELSRIGRQRRSADRSRRLRKLARSTNHQRRIAEGQLQSTCTELAQAYGKLSGQLAAQQLALGYQHELLAASNDDDVFRSLFKLFVKRSGGVFGAALVCNADAELHIVGRFGVPGPDNASFCQALSAPIVEAVLQRPQVLLMDAGENTDRFAPAIRKYLVGVSILAVPLLPTEGEMIGLVILYRKGEQPFGDDDVELARTIGLPTAIAIRRND